MDICDYDSVPLCDRMYLYGGGAPLLQPLAADCDGAGAGRVNAGRACTPELLTEQWRSDGV